MKLKSLVTFFDVKEEKIVQVNSEIDRSNARAKDLIEKGFVEKVEEPVEEIPVEEPEKVEEPVEEGIEVEETELETVPPVEEPVEEIPVEEPEKVEEPVEEGIEVEETELETVPPVEEPVEEPSKKKSSKKVEEK